MSPEPTIALLAGVVLGASAHRAGLCMVKAVAEVLTSRKAHFIWSFVKASLWTAAILGWAAMSGLNIEFVQRRFKRRPFGAASSLASERD